MVNFTFIIPTHNSSLFVAGLLDSIPSRDDIEVIVVDDHSSDYGNLVEVVRGHRLVQSIRLIKNDGVNSAGAARNVGLREATGRWVIFADSDDRFTSDLGAALDRYKDSEFDAVLFRPVEDRGGRRTEYIDHCFGLFSMGKIEAHELSYMMTVVWSKFLRRDAIEGIEYREVAVANDVLYAMKTAFATRGGCAVESSLKIYSVSTRQGSITSNKKGRYLKLARRVYERLRADGWVLVSSLASDYKIPRTGRLRSVFRSFYLK